MQPARRTSSTTRLAADQEPDSAAWAIDPPHPVWALLLTEATDVYPRTGRDFHAGRRAARLLLPPAWGDVHVRLWPASPH